ncbi:phosphate signaling complex protein PhoU [Solihabitans fulvus]|uniref:Phosphate-specific transport system accessory protein PhoU n=1 Tax=Solihabitans fulvus TaxID=1892852 RepID=A0A5B2XD77_9PSEU|nr:phosphate signaling complex protein PhoU [Solihabitans fulvus]KAA2261303.1 phosphate signaling complex protein PhoU [Solihabitans fulvus]
MRESFHERLDELGEQLADMAQQAGAAISGATTALLTADLALAERVVEGDAVIDRARSRCEEHAYALLALQAPVATDLRVVLAGVRIAESLERMGDLAKHIARTARRRHPEHAVPDPVRPAFTEMGRICTQLARATELAVRSRSLTLVRSLEESDDEVDQLYRELFITLMAPGWAYGVVAAVDVALLGRFYERFADHAVGVARQMSFVATGRLGKSD